jgi:hypothetical protein
VNHHTSNLDHDIFTNEPAFEPSSPSSLTDRLVADELERKPAGDTDANRQGRPARVVGAF